MKLIKNKYLVISVRRIKLKKMLDLKIWRTELSTACRNAAVPSMNALNRRVRFILIKFWSSVAIQQLSFSIDVIIWISIFWPTKEKMQKQHVSSLKSGKKKTWSRHKKHFGSDQQTTCENPRKKMCESIRNDLRQPASMRDDSSHETSDNYR